MATAAGDLLAALDDQQLAHARWPFPADSERRRWFYTPTDHGGLPLGAMRPGQQRLALKLVASGLSQAGYVTISTIIGLENALDELEGWTTGWDRERGRDPGLYYLRVFGDPTGGGPWSWRFGGHHVSVHHLVVDGRVRASTPLFFGADPASSPLLGPQPLRPLAGAEDLARELVRSLDGEDRARAVISPIAPVDLVGANRSRLTAGDLPLSLAEIWREPFDGAMGDVMDRMQRRSEMEARLTAEHLAALSFTDAPKGLPVAALTADQRRLFRELLDVYLHRVPDELAEIEARKYAGDGVDRLCFAWAGGSEPGDAHYYRIQGGPLLIEYDNTQRGANHVHSVWRDLRSDFGDDVLRLHHARHHGPPGTEPGDGGLA